MLNIIIRFFLMALVSIPLFADDLPDHSRWMEQLEEKSSRSLRHLILPGSHDSGTFSLSHHSPFSSEANLPDWVKGLASTMAPVKRVIANWARTQSLSIKEQLRYGIRYFDLRVCANNQGVPHICHTLMGKPLDEVLLDFAAFAQAFLKEILILDFNHFYNMTRERHLAFMQKLEELFAERAIAFDSSDPLTLGSLWDRQVNVLIVYHQDEVIKERNSFWPSFVIDSPWPNSQSPEHLYQKLQEAAQKQRDQGLFVLQGILTPDTKMVKDSLNPFKRVPRSLASLAETMNPKLLQWVAEKSKENLNIVMLDWVQKGDLMGKVLELNAAR